MKVSELKKEKHPKECSKCVGLIKVKALYGIWMDIFMLVIDACNYSIEAAKSLNFHAINDIDNCLDDVIEILEDSFLTDNVPELFKVGLSKYLPDYISRMNGVESLDQIHSKVLKIKEKV